MGVVGKVQKRRKEGGEKEARAARRGPGLERGICCVLSEESPAAHHSHCLDK